MGLLSARQETILIHLVTDDLSADQIQKWESYLAWAMSKIGRPWELQKSSSLVLDSDSEFCVLSSATSLGPKLASAFSTIFLWPNRKPCAPIDPWLASLTDAPCVDSGGAATPRVGLMSSVFRADEFLEGFLSNCEELVGYLQHEHWLIRPGSPGKEHDRLISHVRKHPNAIYINLLKDPGLYEVWNIAQRLSNAKYLSNANLDDRRAPDQVETLICTLETKPEIDLASTALRVSTKKNLAWHESGDCRVMYGDLLDHDYGADGLIGFSSAKNRPRNLPHCMPLWRKSLSAWNGDFNERIYGPSADWAYWLKAGMAGARFTFLSQPRGLYLRDSESYWRRGADDSGESVFDQKILHEFSGIVRFVGGTGNRSFQPLSHELRVVEARLQCGAIWEGLAYLFTVLAQHPREVRQSALPMINLWSQRLFDGDYLASIISEFESLLGFDRNRSAEILVIELARLVCADASALKPAVLRNLEWLTCGAHVSSRQSAYGILLAWVAGKSGDPGREVNLLKKVYALDAHGFWRAFQQVYRFDRTLEEVMRLLDCSSFLEPFSKSSSQLALYFYPDFTKSNEYQSLLYCGLIDQGAQVKAASSLSEFLQATLQLDKTNVLHIHWLSPIFARQRDRAEIESDAQRLLVGLAQKKREGFRLDWTLHNVVSHESVAPDLEWDFQRKLYALVDRVWVHHPLAAYQVDWLPDHKKLCLLEHGANPRPMQVPDDKARARQLLGLESDCTVLMHMGLVRPYKGLEENLSVLAQGLDRHPKLLFVLAGKIASPTVRQWVLDFAHPRLIVKDLFLPTDELWRYMTAADFGLLSYSRVLTSGSLMHWFSCARPVLASRTGTIPGYVVEGWNGLGFDNPAQLSGAIDWMMGLSKDAYAELTAHAKQVGQGLKWGLAR